ADTRFGQGEGRILGGYDEVASERDLETATHRNAIDRSDDRLVAVEARGQSGEAALVPAAFATCRLPLEIVAGAKSLVAGAGDDRDPLLGVGAEIVEHLVELVMRFNMKRVVHFGSRQRHDRDRPLARDFGKFQLHRSSRELFYGAEWLILTRARRSVPFN